jgi:hypothetical protein
LEAEKKKIGNLSEMKGARKGRDQAGRGCWKKLGAVPFLLIFKPGKAQEASATFFHSV